ncbi:hypothetical protein [Streptacidiphilus carbonis]|jgi:uncharacterized oligopeptide transporter (OPT) family protein|uniref:hypothetical protein n=1 Tax=Streptacidiphilus carbonis TaxID=105422 RepID=UPI0005A68E0C|nr:hypothetical protein [Streptacidiphilus carbonis]
MSSVWNGIGDALGTIMNVTSDVALTGFLVVLGLLVVAVPLYMVYAVVSSARPAARKQPPAPAGTRR